MPMWRGGRIFLAAALVASVVALAIPAHAASAAADSGPVLAEIGNHKITQQQHEQLLARLRKDGGAKILLAPPRVDVNLSAAGHPTLGSKHAPVTVVEFADFQCPFCKRSEDAVKAIHEKYVDRVRLVFMDF